MNRQAVSASDISLFVKHPHGKLKILDDLKPPPGDPHPLPMGGRRPVVALLDSEVQPHPWLEIGNVPWWTTVVPPAGNAEMVDEPGARVDVLPKDDQFSDNDKVVAEPFVQHGTFNAGIIRQLAPDATVLSFPVMSTTEDIAHADVRNALGLVRDRAAKGAGDFVDVVCLPFGYLSGRASSEHQGAERSLVQELAALGVRVVAAAGNFGTNIEVFPAAFALERPPSGPALVSVGALDQNGKPAPYSNFGNWVTHWEVGTDIDSIVSDPPGAFARGRGTSFAAARLAGKLVAELSRDLVALADTTPLAAIARAEWALQQVTGRRN